jgi:hypothetical protein
MGDDGSVPTSSVVSIRTDKWACSFGVKCGNGFDSSLSSSFFTSAREKMFSSFKLLCAPRQFFNGSPADRTYLESKSRSAKRES